MQREAGYLEYGHRFLETFKVLACKRGASVSSRGALSDILTGDHGHIRFHDLVETSLDLQRLRREWDFIQYEDNMSYIRDKLICKNLAIHEAGKMTDRKYLM